MAGEGWWAGDGGRGVAGGGWGGGGQSSRHAVVGSLVDAPHDEGEDEDADVDTGGDEAVCGGLVVQPIDVVHLVTIASPLGLVNWKVFQQRHRVDTEKDPQQRQHNDTPY